MIVSTPEVATHETDGSPLPRSSTSDVPADGVGSDRGIALGLRANWKQFTLLVIVNAFVGAMVGLERAVLPVIATEEFRVASTTAVLSFIATFGIAKAFTNLAAGWMADRRTRRPILLLGWLVAIPVPFLILHAPGWTWIVAANALLGINQGLAWSTTVIMKIDLVGARRRGLAMGLNEFAGYVSVGMAGLGGGYLASQFGLRAGLAYAGLAIVAAGLTLSLFVHETAPHVHFESASAPRRASADRPTLRQILVRSLWSDAGLFSVSQAGLVNNLNDGLAWGVFPLLLLKSGLDLRQMSVLVAIYPVTWGLSQLATGALSDYWGRKRPIVAGMLVQAVALGAMTIAHSFAAWATALAGLGVGTALVYPTLLAAVGDMAHPSWRGIAVGVYRLWRDLGYVFGALIAGTLADLFGTSVAINAVGVLTAFSGVVFALRFHDVHTGQPRRARRS